MAENLIPQPLLDWYGVWPGQTGIDEKNEMWVQDMPVGVRLAVQEARSSEIFIKAERPWEERTVSPFTVVHEDGKLKLWYYSCGGDKEDRTFVAYAESEDGFQWQRPELGLQEYRGSKANNLLLGIDDFEMQAVFVDPSSPPDERYKALGRDALCFHKGVAVPKMTHERKWELRREMEEAGYTLDQMNAELQFHGLLLGAVSPDGWQWTVLEEPLLNVGQTQLDSQNIAAYDPDTRQYLGYLRGHQDRRRTVRRTEGKEFRDWNPTHDVFGMDPQDPQGDDVYTSGYCRCPGSGRHLMFPAIYHRLTSAVDVQLASSRDGVLWSRPERKPIISCEAGDDRYLTLYAFPNLVPLSEEEWGLMFIGQFNLHDWGNRHDPKRESEWRWAQWKRDRLVALEAPVLGRVTLTERECMGEELRLNFQTQKEGGWVKVELVEPPVSAAIRPSAPVKPFAGFGLEEADPLSGDDVSRLVTWRGRSDLSALKGRKVSIRLHLARAKTFSTAL